MTYTNTRIRTDYREKLRLLAEADRRSMAKMMEYLIDVEIKKMQKYCFHAEFKNGKCLDCLKTIAKPSTIA